MGMASSKFGVRRGGLTIALAGAVSLLCGQSLRAALTLTPAGVAQGLSLSTFASGFPSSGSVGPLGIGFTSTGGVIVSDFPGNVRVFATDTDNQTAASAPIGQNYGLGNAVGIAQVGNTFYMTQQGNGDLVQINSNGTFNQAIVAGLPSATGIITNPLNGHLFVSTLGNNVIWDVDPVAKSKTLFVNAAPDGLSISPDGKTLYGALSTSHIVGYDTTTKAVVFDSGAIPGGIDGTAVGTGLFAGLIFANTNGGTLVEVNLSTLAQTTIATGGSRGDFVTIDPATNTLLITQTDSIIRLTGASFTTVPSPGSLTMMATGILGSLGAYGWIRRRSV
jgi:hypothetical protein